MIQSPTTKKPQTVEETTDKPILESTMQSTMTSGTMTILIFLGIITSFLIISSFNPRLFS